VTALPRHLVTRLFNNCAALLPAASTIAVDLLARASDRIEASVPGSAFGISEDLETEDRARPYDIVCGVAIIPIRGVLIQRLGWLWSYGDLFGISGYDRMRLQFMRALADPNVDAIAFDLDSPGGEVAGCFDLVDTIYRARGSKPIAAILGESAYSAAYAIASAVDPGRVWVPRTGGTGSVGVIYLHLSIAGWLAKSGITPTLVTKGAFKGEGNEMFDLSEDALEHMQADIDAVGQLFDATVARNRGLAIKDVTRTQAGTFLGGKGVDIGFADAVAAPDEAFRALLKQLN
jgi:ClpP class serine protease